MIQRVITLLHKINESEYLKGELFYIEIGSETIWKLFVSKVPRNKNNDGILKF